MIELFTPEEFDQMRKELCKSDNVQKSTAMKKQNLSLKKILDENSVNKAIGVFPSYDVHKAFICIIDHAVRNYCIKRNKYGRHAYGVSPTIKRNMIDLYSYSYYVLMDSLEKIVVPFDPEQFAAEVVSINKWEDTRK